ncbi:MAG: glycosyltransferase family 2 protein, partial [Methanocella sp.]
MGAQSPLVSVVIVNYNGMRFLEGCLSSLMKQSYSPIEIILVDNGSSDGSLEFVKSHYAMVKIIENDRNLGFAIANNEGIGITKGKLIATLNIDTEVTPCWVEAHVRAMASDAMIGMCSSKMLSMGDPRIIDSTGLCISRSGACWDRGQYETDAGQYEETEEVFGPCAGAAMYRKEMLDKIGLFDEDFFAYMEDADLAFRGQLAGWKCIYVPEAIALHY